MPLWTSLEVAPGWPSMPVGKMESPTVFSTAAGSNVRSGGALLGGMVFAWKVGTESVGDDFRPGWCYGKLSALSGRMNELKLTPPVMRGWSRGLLAWNCPWLLTASMLLEWWSFEAAIGVE